MATDVILGTDLMLFNDGKALAAATSCKLSLSANVLETSSKDSGKWVSKKAGKLSWTASSDNLFTMTDYKDLVTAMITRTPIQIQFSTVQNADSDNGVPADGWVANTDGFMGNAIITSIEANASDGDNATYSVSLEGSGALSPVEA